MPLLKESTMRSIAIALLALFCTSPSLAALQTKTIEYKVGDQTYEGFLAWDDAQDVQKPGVIVIHEWWGNDDYSRSRARQLAELGYVGFAIDLFGRGKTTQDPKQAGEWAGAVRGNPEKARPLLEAALKTLKEQPQVDPSRTAAIGYCFGGTMALNMARWGMDVGGVGGVHGDLAHPNPQQNAAKVNGKVRVAHGAAEPVGA